jgi:hypothetical protein
VLARGVPARVIAADYDNQEFSEGKIPTHARLGSN